MPTLRYVCLSDTHFGACNSLITHLDDDGWVDATQPSHTLVALVACLRELVERLGDPARPPTLILNGDILDLALSSTSASSMVFERFVELVFPPPESGLRPLFDSQILFLPGNHDHHLWETARERQYALDLADTSPGTVLPEERHTTAMFGPHPVPADYLTTLMRRYPHLKTAAVRTAYPSFGVASSDGKRAVVFNHGHYVESIYYLLTRTIDIFFPDRPQPQTMEEIERENFAWIDFFWGTLGRSGAAGKDVEVLYDKIQDEKATRELIGRLAHAIAYRSGNAGFVEWAKEKVLDQVLESVLGKLAHLGRNAATVPFSVEAVQGLERLLGGPLRKQMIAERGQLPPELTFVFGHTHKPFEALYAIAGFVTPVALYNSGGWAVDTPARTPVVGGAVILIDDDLDVVSLRMFNEAVDPRDYAVHVAVAGREKGELAGQVRAAIDASAATWRHFSSEVATAIEVRARWLREEIAGDGADRKRAVE